MNTSRTDRETERDIRFNAGDFAFLRANGQKTEKTFPVNAAPRVEENESCLMRVLGVPGYTRPVFECRVNAPDPGRERWGY